MRSVDICSVQTPTRIENRMFQIEAHILTKMCFKYKCADNYFDQ